MLLVQNNNFCVFSIFCLVFFKVDMTNWQLVVVDLQSDGEPVILVFSSILDWRWEKCDDCYNN